MRTILPAITVLTLLIGIGPAAAAPTTTWHWHSSPTSDAQGQSLAPALYYEVFVACNDEPESLVATVNDTIWRQQAPVPGCTYRVRVRGVDYLGRKSAMSNPSDLWTAPALSGVPATDAIGVGPAWPNPFNPATTIAYTVPEGAVGSATLQILDLRGRLVRTLPADAVPGRHEVRWNGVDAGGRPAAAGVYLVSLRCGAARAVTRITLVE